MIQTVNGMISETQIRQTLAHEHFVFGLPGFAGDTENCYQRETALMNGLERLAMTAKWDVNFIIDLTTAEWGRDPLLLKKLSEASGCHIVCSTGLFKDEGNVLSLLKSASYTDNPEDILEKFFIREIKVGIGQTGIRAGTVKVASSLDKIQPLERTIFMAAIRAHKNTGVPIFTHCDRGTMGSAQADIFLEQGVCPQKVVIGHMTSNRDLSEIMRLMDAGFRVGFDQFGILSIPGIPSDEEKIENLLKLLKHGYEDSIVLSHDCIFDRMGYVSSSKPRFPDMIFKQVLPALRNKGISDKILAKLTRDNLLKVFE